MLVSLMLAVQGGRAPQARFPGGGEKIIVFCSLLDSMKNICFLMNVDEKHDFVMLSPI